MQGICIDKGDTLNLEVGKRYFLFPNGTTHFYVSRFNKSTSHFGCYRAKHFEVIKDEWPPEPDLIEHDMQRGQIYKAGLIWRRPGYKSIELQDYYLKMGVTHLHVYKDEKLSKYLGCFPPHWFTDYRLIELHSEKETTQEEALKDEKEPTHFEQLALF